jgi:hypothetical protein
MQFGHARDLRDTQGNTPRSRGRRLGLYRRVSQAGLVGGGEEDIYEVQASHAVACKASRVRAWRRPVALSLLSAYLAMARGSQVGRLRPERRPVWPP